MIQKNKLQILNIFDPSKNKKLIFIISMMLLGSIALSAKETNLNQTIEKSAKSGQGITEEWKNFSDTDIKKPYKGLSSMVVFRPLNSAQGPAINLYIDGEYQASLLAGAYTQASFCPGTHRFSIAYTNILTKYKEKVQVGQKSTFYANNIRYYQIDQDSKQKLVIHSLSEEKALDLIRKLPPRQRHTIPRLDKRECPINKKYADKPDSNTINIYK